MLRLFGADQCMENIILLLRKNLKTILFLAVLSICSSGVWAQVNINPGFVKIKYDTGYSNEFYLCEEMSYTDYNSIGVDIRNTSTMKTFYLDTISKGRCLLAVNVDETREYSKGRFWFNNSPNDNFGNPISPDVAENCFFSKDVLFEKNILSVEAIRFGNILYVTEIPNAEDYILDFELSAANGSIKKIDLSKTNNFIFSFNKVDFEGLPEGRDFLAINSDIGGEVVLNSYNSKAMVVIDKPSTSISYIFEIETVDNPYIENPIYRRLDFGKGDIPYTLEFYNIINSVEKFYENSGNYLNKNEIGGGGSLENLEYNGDYKRDSLGNVLSFLGYNNSMQFGSSTNYSFYVDTAYVNRGTGLIKPQYMLAVDTYTTGGYVIARYLYNTSMYARSIVDNEYADKYFDKTKGEGIQVSENETESGYLFKSDNYNTVKPVSGITRSPNGMTYLTNFYPRLAFAWAIHKGDSLYVLKGAKLEPVYNKVKDAAYQLWLTLSREYGEEGKSIDFSKLINENIVPGSEYKEAYYPLGHKSTYPEMRTYYDYKPSTALSPGKTIGLQSIIALDDNTHKDWIFSFRLHSQGSDDFMIESEAAYRNTRNYPVLNLGKSSIVTLQHGVPVISPIIYSDMSFMPMIFNVNKTDNPPVSNKSFDADAKKAVVISEAGGVTILNASGKTVIIKDMLGRTIANSSVSSDYISFTTPSGIIIVSIEGEKATKVFVK